MFFKSCFVYYFFYEFGLGPYLTRFNYTTTDLPEFSISPLFGFLFGGGYERRLFPGISLQLKGELLVNAPVFLVDYLDTDLKNSLYSSRYSEYNIKDFQSVLFNASVSLGVRYEFGKNIRIPLEDVFYHFLNSNAVNRFKRIRPGAAE